ncbi:MAG: tetratricopeptide repeat protein, partial [Acidobacteria bacterium]|nr:tetratricopeptide repeat protein [Acidobacteriota bacterium]
MRSSLGNRRSGRRYFLPFPACAPGRPRVPEFSWVITLLLIAAVLGNCSARGPAQEGTSQAGPAALRAGEYSKARTAFESALQSDPDSEDALAGLLETLRHVGEYEQADALASRHLAKKPASAAVRLEAGRIARSRGRLDEAEEHLRQAVSGGGGAAGDPSAEAERELAELLSYTGRAEEAARFWERLIERYRRGQAGDSDVMGHVAVAAWRTGYVHDAKDFFIDATEEGSGRPVSLRALADFGYLFLEKYNAADAIGCFRDCLRINPSFPPALVGIALAKKYESNAEVEKYARAALEVNPRFVPALNLLAELRFESEDHDGGLSEVRRALEVNPRDLDALSLEAVYHHARGDEAMQREVEARVAAIHPAYGQLYHALAEDLVRRRKYAEAVEQERKAIGLDPGLWPAYASLGINLMRLGDLAGGRQMIERAFQGDPFNVWAFNTLDLLDQMDRFVTVRSRNFVFLMSKEDEAVIAPYLVKIAEEAHGSLSRRYGFTPAGPIQVEVFPDHGGFAVRTLGLPGLGALGVCFGRVVAMDSPRAQKQGSFNWGSTLWHEFAHVITLQMTRHNIPRWFSEGLSVYEEHRGRPGWGDDLTAGMVKAYQEGKLLKV